MTITTDKTLVQRNSELDRRLLNSALYLRLVRYSLTTSSYPLNNFLRPRQDTFSPKPGADMGQTHLAS
jgi:hypothetical protein